MAKYINEKDIYNLFPQSGIERLHVAQIDELPRADVAPRAEVAREVFSEIERLMLDGAIGGKYPAKVINPDKYAELKKKYMEKST